MFEKMHQMFWKALTPDLVPDQPRDKLESNYPRSLSQDVIVALGGLNNVKSMKVVALTRLRVELHDAGQIDVAALRVAGVTGVMALPQGVFHLLIGLQASVA